ncbi:MAG: MraY family glycosyltransferase [Dehalococcoidia bacterium]
MPSLGLDVYVLVFVLAAAGAWGLTALLPLQRLARPAEARLGRRRAGGLAIFAAFLLAPLLVCLVSSDLADLLASQKGETAGLLGAALMILLLGLLDDLREVDFKIKFLVQTAAAALVFVVGYRIEHVALPWGTTFSLGWAAPVLTILWLVFLTNAMNLIDGKDGVAAGVAIIVAVPLALIAASVDHPLVAAQLVAVAGACAGFLPSTCRWPRACWETQGRCCWASCWRPWPSRAPSVSPAACSSARPLSPSASLFWTHCSPL